ncbi:inositol 2-dehydrogenase [Jannaschia sp. LMIT008]|uniref:inositol 2-dehydrogenase n=1 Tax=Jannaschia maritima TaxID=3032585 RepID=UPI002810B567|nr:inositol 2-dehydrogenase [Jannaschia sp. LMIT008]
MPYDPVRYAVLGAGRIGQVHARAIAATEGARLVAVHDPDAMAARAVVDRHGGTIRDMAAIEAADDVDAVMICTPTDTHAALIERFARAGKAVFCEKPVDLDAARVRACLDVVRETGAVLMVGFQRRHDPDFRALKAAIDEGRIGAVEMIHLTARDPAPPPIAYIERSGGLFRDMMIHDLDVARWLLPDEPVRVTAQAATLVDPAIGEAGDYDSAIVTLQTASGAMCSIHNSRRATYGYDQRIEVHGSAGAVSAANPHAARITLAGEGGYTDPPLLDSFMTRYADAYAAEIAHFTACLRDGTTPATTGEDGLRALVLADAALESVRTGRTVDVA